MVDTGRYLECDELIRIHSDLLQQLGEAAQLCKDYRKEIAQRTELLLGEQLKILLREIPVEEVNRDHRGIRVKTLRDHGYRTMADLYSASLFKLESISGISEDAAREIKQVADGIASQASSGCRIRLSPDNRTNRASQLVLALSCYLQSVEPAKQCKQMLSNKKLYVEHAIADLESTSGALRWLFSSSDKKERAAIAEDYLRTQLAGPYGAAVLELTGTLERIRHTDLQTAWDHFSAESIRFYQTLEEICPGVMGAEDSVYGLPEELAEQIQQEPILTDGLRCQLRRYQEWGVKYILHQKRVLLGDEMGLGKTVQAIGAMVSMRNSGSTHFLVVCPASVLENWCREIRKHSDLSVIKVHGTSREEAAGSWIREGGVAVTTYETAGMFELEPEFRFSMAVVDEAHYIKNPEAQRTVHVQRICGHADCLLFMTGTALENKVSEMITLISMLQPKLAMGIRSMASLASAPQFRERIAPVYYRRKRDDVLTELPDLIDNPEWCTLSLPEEAVYEKAVLVKNFTESRRVSWNMPDPHDSAKANRMLELIEDSREDDRKVIIFTFFLDTIRKIQTLLGDACLPPITGSVDPKKRQQIVDQFDAAPAGTCLVAQIQAGGTGLNIQAASVVILCEPQLKPSIENQAISRAYRMGQTRNVLVYRLLCEDTIDERITDILRQKQSEFDAFADESVVAAESLELDRRTLGTLLDEERQRIQDKREKSDPTGTSSEPG